MEYQYFIVGLLLMIIINGKESKACSYQYNQQPETMLKCNPYGSQLQLHCGVTGPLVPMFTTEWYSSSLDNVTGVNSEMNVVRLSPLPEYQVENIILDVMGETRSVSSIIRTNSISSEHTGKCFWCQIEFETLHLPHTSNALCIEGHDYYSTILRTKSCKDEGNIGAMLVDTTVLCVNISDNLAADLQRLKDVTTMSTLFELAPTRSYSVLEPSRTHPTHTMHEAKEKGSVLGMVTLTSSHTDDNITTLSLHTISPVAMTSTQTQEKTTPRSTQSGNSVSLLDSLLVASTQNSTDEKMDETVPRSSFEGALYAAIVVCIMFVGVIVVLIVVIVCLLKRKCSCLSQVGSTSSRAARQIARLRNRRRDMASDGNCSQLALNDMNRRSNANSLVESGIHSDHLELSTHCEDHIHKDVPDGSSQPLAYNERSVDDWKVPVSRQANNRDSQLPPELPPKPRKTDTLLTRSYDHLDPIKTADSYVDSSLSTQLDPSLEVAPKKPPRSRSGDHFYHTLERSNDDSGLLRSATASHTSSQANDLGRGDPDNVDTMSSRLKELFDDPRYAMLIVDSQEGGEQRQIVRGLTKRRDFSRSSPSIVTLLQPSPEIQIGVPERRSLRLPKWLSANKTHEIYEN